MTGFLERAKEQAQRGIQQGKEQAQRGLQQGKEKYEDVQAQRAGAELLRKLGAAYYRQERGGGSPEDVQLALAALEDHLREHGDRCLK